MAGSYSVTTCPCCGNKITPARRQNERWFNWHPGWLDELLRKRPPSAREVLEEEYEEERGE